MEAVAELLLDAVEDAGDVSLGMSEDLADPFEWPPCIFTEGEYREVLPSTFVFVGEVLVNEPPECVCTLPGELDLDADTIATGHAETHLGAE